MIKLKEEEEEILTTHMIIGKLGTYRLSAASQRSSSNGTYCGRTLPSAGSRTPTSSGAMASSAVVVRR